MNTKTLLAGLVGGVAAFFLGWIIYGMLMKNMMAEHCDMSLMKPEDQTVWWALIISQLAWGMSVALLLSWANVTDFMGGLTKGAMFGFVLCLGISLQYYSMSNMYKDMTGVAMDVIGGTVMNAIIGGIVGWMLGRGNTNSAA